MNTRNHILGELKISNSSLDKIDYGLFDNSTPFIRFMSISTILDRIYNSPSPNLIFTLRTAKDNLSKASIQISKSGRLHISRDPWGVNDYFIGEFPLGLYLHELTGEKVEIFIEHLTENAEAAGNNEQIRYTSEK